jgi:alpha-tubulin suppressor-like RCC1 family protein
MRRSYLTLVLVLFSVSCGEDDVRTPGGDDESPMGGTGGEEPNGPLAEGSCGASREACESAQGKIRDLPPDCTLDVTCEPSGCFFLAADYDQDGYRANCAGAPDLSFTILPNLPADDPAKHGKVDCNDKRKRVHPGAKDWPADDRDEGNCALYENNNCDALIDCDCDPKDNTTIPCFETPKGAEITWLRERYDDDAQSLLHDLPQSMSCKWGYRECKDRDVWSVCHAAQGPLLENCDDPNKDWDCDGFSAREEVFLDDQGPVEALTSYYCDKDGDGRLSPNAEALEACVVPNDQPCGDSEGNGDWIEDPRSDKFNDCNDENPLVYRGAEELCDEFDNNCNGSINDNVKPRGHETVAKFECVDSGWTLTCKTGRLNCNPEAGPPGVDDGCEKEANTLENCGICGRSCDFACGVKADREETEPEFECASVVQLAVGSVHVCATLSDGRAACWGKGSDGELGASDDPDDSTSPLEVAKLADVRSVEVGALAIEGDQSHSCAIVGAVGNVYCWGAGTRGQNGKATTGIGSNIRNQPALVDFLGVTIGAVDLALGSQHSLAVAEDGKVYVWGDGSLGQLGDGGLDDGGPDPTLFRSSGTPAQLLVGGTDPQNIDDAIQASAFDNHSCVVTQTGAVLCGGYNESGVLGNGFDPSSYDPGYFNVVQGVTGASYVETGFGHSCALVEGGRVVCWGLNDVGQLGRGDGDDDPFDEDYAEAPLPAFVNSPSGDGPFEGVDAISVGHSHTCALVQGVAYCWGAPYGGQLGLELDPEAFPPALPTRVPNLADIKAVDAGEQTTCALVGEEWVPYCWGVNNYGQVGRGGLPSTGSFEGLSPAPVVHISGN